MKWKINTVEKPVYADYSETYHHIIDQDNMNICSLRSWRSKDAKLIAAAPMMLQCLMDLEKVGMSIQHNSVIWDDIRAAIKKATE